MPACRQMSLTGTPASACLRIETIWVSVKRDFFMEPPGWGNMPESSTYGVSADRGSLRIHHSRDEPDGVVMDADDLVISLAGLIGTADFACSKPAARMVLEVGAEAAGPDEGRHAARTVTCKDFGHVTKRIGDRPQVAFAPRAGCRRDTAGWRIHHPVGERGEIAYVRARAVH